MKTLQILSVAVAGLMSIASANALTTDEIKTACMVSDKTIWVETNKVCITRRPCTKGNTDVKRAYCNDFFKDTQIESIEKAQNLANTYAKRHLGSSCTFIDTLNESGIVGQDEIGCQLANGHYVAFQFDDTTENFVTDYSDFTNAICAIFGYTGHTEGFGSNTTKKCIGPKTNDDCMGMNEYITFDGNFAWDGEHCFVNM